MDHIAHVHHNISLLFTCNSNPFHIGYSKIKNAHFLLIESDQVVVFYRKMFLYKHCINVDIEKKENIHANGFLNKKKS